MPLSPKMIVFLEFLFGTGLIITMFMCIVIEYAKRACAFLIRLAEEVYRENRRSL